MLTTFRFLRKKSETNLFELKPILVKGFTFQTSLLLFVFVNRYSYYLLPDIANVGLYSSASSLVEALLIIVNGISPVLLARVSNTRNTSKSVDLTLALSKASFILSFISVLILVLIPESFFVLVLGQGFQGIKQMMILYSPGVLLVSLFGSMSYYFFAIGKQKVVLYCYSIGFISTLLFAPVLIKNYENAGAAYNANIAYTLIAVAVCSAFTVTNKLGLKRFFSLRNDFNFIKKLIFSPETIS